MLSRRLPADMSPSPFYTRQQSLKAGGDVLDLTLSSPLHAGLRLDVSSIFQEGNAESAWLGYSPSAQGALATRQAVADYHARLQGEKVSADSIWVTASTSESYAALFKVFCDPGDSILVPVPGYPLLDALANLEHLQCHPYFLREGSQGWEIDLDSLLSLPERTRMLLVVAPHNPTGHSPSEREWRSLVAFCAEHRLVLVVDEVFGAYHLDDGPQPHWMRQSGPSVPTFWLDGLSKSVGQPQLKVGWMRCSLPETQRASITHGLEYVLDASLSVSSLSQSVCGPLLVRSTDFQFRVRERLRANRQAVLDVLGPLGHVPPVQGGWYQCVRLAGIDDEAFCLGLLEKYRVLVQPGFFFDFTQDDWLVLSLVCDESVFRTAVGLIADYYLEVNT